MNDRTRRAIRAALSLILVALYLLGLVAMLTFSFRTGLILWVISTLGGIGLLYWIRAMDRHADAGREDGPEETGKDDAEA